MHLARLATLDYKTDLSAHAFANQVMMNGRNGEQRWHWRLVARNATIGEQDDAISFGDGLARSAAKVVQCTLEAALAVICRKQHRQRY